MRVLDSMTDRYLADPLLSSKGRTGGGLRITLASIRTYQSTVRPPLHRFILHLYITHVHIHTILAQTHYTLVQNQTIFEQFDNTLAQDYTPLCTLQHNPCTGGEHC